MALMVLFCIYLMALWWRSGDTFYFITPSIILDLLLLCGSLFACKITAEWMFETLDEQRVQAGGYVAAQ